MDLNVRPQNVKLLQENIGEKLLDIYLGNDVSGYDTKSTVNKRKNKQVGLHQTKKPLHSKINDQQDGKATYRMEKMFANHVSDKGLIPKINKEFMQCNSKKPQTTNKKPNHQHQQQNQITLLKMGKKPK